MLLATLLIAACSPTRGCRESSFTLSEESRLPKWFASAGLAREQATVTMNYWIGPIGRTATLALKDSRGRSVASNVGQLEGDEPRSLTPHGEIGPLPYPLYEIISADGVTEIIEHRGRQPIFYVSDDPQVQQKLDAGQGKSRREPPATFRSLRQSQAPVQKRAMA